MLGARISRLFSVNPQCTDAAGDALKPDDQCNVMMPPGAAVCTCVLIGGDLSNGQPSHIRDEEKECREM